MEINPSLTFNPKHGEALHVCYTGCPTRYAYEVEMLQDSGDEMAEETFGTVARAQTKRMEDVAHDIQLTLDSIDHTLKEMRRLLEKV